MQAQGAFIQRANEEDLPRHPDLPDRRARSGVLRPRRGARRNSSRWLRRTPKISGARSNLTRERLQAGRGTAFDTERAQAQLSTTLASIRPSKVACGQRSMRSAAFLGRIDLRRRWRTSSKLRSPCPIFRILRVFPAPAILSEIRRRPDVAAAERHIGSPAGARGSWQGRRTSLSEPGRDRQADAAAESSGLADHGTFRYARWSGDHVAGSEPGTHQGAGRSIQCQGTRARRCQERCHRASGHADTSRDFTRALPHRARQNGPAPGCGRCKRAGRGVGEIAVHRRSRRISWRCSMPSGFELEAQDQLAQSRTRCGQPAYVHYTKGRWAALPAAGSPNQ